MRQRRAGNIKGNCGHRSDHGEVALGEIHDARHIVDAGESDADQAVDAADH